jgi:hypothetical protein
MLVIRKHLRTPPQTFMPAGDLWNPCCAVPRSVETTRKRAGMASHHPVFFVLFRAVR